MLVFLAGGVASAEPHDASRLLDKLRAERHAPALAGEIVRAGQPLAVGVCGVRRQGAAAAATRDDLWPLGSCSKPMARFIVGRLVERGVVRLDTTLGELFAGVALRDEYKPVTLKDLLAHRAGIQPYTEIGPRRTPELFELKGSPTEQRAAFAAHVLGAAPAAPPGTRVVYSNAGYCVAAAALERKTGRTWEQLVHDELFAPLKMGAAVVGDRTPAGGLPSGHLHTPDGYEPEREPRAPLAAMIPAGGIAASIDDFARFAAAKAELEGGRAAGGVSADVARELAEGGDGDGPLGPFFGGDGWYTAALAVWPKQRLAIVVATNAGEADELCGAAIEALRREYAPDAPTARLAARPTGPNDGPRFGFTLLNENGELRIGEVASGSIAARGGLRDGDVLIEIDGRPTRDMSDVELRSAVQRQRLRLTIERNRERQTVTLDKGQ